MAPPLSKGAGMKIRVAWQVTIRAPACQKHMKTRKTRKTTTFARATPRGNAVRFGVLMARGWGWRKGGQFSHMLSQIGMDWDFKMRMLLQQGSDSDINLVLFDRFTFCTRPRSDRTATSIRFC